MCGAADSWRARRTARWGKRMRPGVLHGEPGSHLSRSNELVAVYGFEEGSDTKVIDASSNGNDGGPSGAHRINDERIF